MSILLGRANVMREAAWVALEFEERARDRSVFLCSGAMLSACRYHAVNQRTAEAALHLHSSDHQDCVVARSRDELALMNRRSDVRVLSIGIDPAWYILLEVFVRCSSGAAPSVKSVGVESPLSAATISRYISLLEADGLLRKHPDPADRRRTWIMPTHAAIELITSLFYPEVPRSPKPCLRSGLVRRANLQKDDAIDYISPSAATSDVRSTPL